MADANHARNVDPDDELTLKIDTNQNVDKAIAVALQAIELFSKTGHPIAAVAVTATSQYTSRRKCRSRMRFDPLTEDFTYDTRILR